MHVPFIYQKNQIQRDKALQNINEANIEGRIHFIVKDI